MTATERRQRGTKLCERLTHDVAGIAPDGIGSWPKAWAIVAEADADFIAALTRWEATGSEEVKPALRDAYFAVLAAWKRAAAEYHRHQGAER